MKLERIQTIYSELEQYVVQLNADPRSLGPQYLNDLIATTRNHLNAVSRIQLEVHQEKQYLSREIRAREAAYQVSADELLANDERVRRLPSIEDRKATVSVFLRADRLQIDHFKGLLQDIEFVDKAVRHRHKELTSTMSEIKLQRSLIRDEIDTGAMYGDERTQGNNIMKGRNYVAHPVDEVTEAELEALLNGTSNNKEEPPQTATVTLQKTPVKEESVDEASQISAFLGISQETDTEEEDLAKILEDF